MPYSVKKQGDKYVVYKKDTGKRVGATAGNKTALRKYLAALHINAKESVTEQQVLREYITNEITRALVENDTIDVLSSMIRDISQDIRQTKPQQDEVVGLGTAAFILNIPGLTSTIINGIKTLLKKSGFKISLKKKGQKAWYDQLDDFAKALDEKLDAPFNMMLSPIIKNEAKRKKYANFFKCLILVMMAIAGSINWEAFQKTKAFAIASAWEGGKEALSGFFQNPKIVNFVSKNLNSVLANVGVV